MSGSRRAAISLVLFAACGDARLVDLTSLPPGDDCAAGGVRVQHGTDDNGDGVLQDGEIDTTETLCNGTDAGAALVDISPEPAGTNCGNGGTHVRTGVDVDDDGALDGGEAQQDFYICNSTPGVATLFASETEPPGAHCMLGGVVVRSGDDVDHDGMLDAEEVTSTSYVCTGQVPVDEVVAGGFHLANGFDQALIANVRRLLGKLTVAPNASLPHPILPLLEEVGGLRVASSTSLQTLQFPALQRTPAFVIQSVPMLESLEMPALEQIDPTDVGIVVSAPLLPACQVTELVTQTGYTGAVSITALPCAAPPNVEDQ